VSAAPGARRRFQCHTLCAPHQTSGGLDKPGRRPGRAGRRRAAGRTAARVGEFLAAIEAPLVITPWRSVLVCDLDEAVADAALRVLAPLGLIFDENSPELNVPRLFAAVEGHREKIKTPQRLK